MSDFTNSHAASNDGVDMSALGFGTPLAEPAPAEATTVFLYNMDKLDAAKALLSDGATLQEQTGWNNIGRNHMNTAKFRPAP